MRSSYRWVTVLATVAAGSVLAGPAHADTTVTARLEPVNGSDIRGTARLTARDDGSLTVVIRGSGYLPGQSHAQHVHGSFGGGRHFMCPSMENDDNGDGVLTNEEGAGEYGQIFLALTTGGDTTPASGLTGEMPVADDAGRIDYRRTLPPAAVPDVLLDNLADVHVVQHGIDVNDNGTYDFASLGPSTFARNLGLGRVPEEATNPASCGVVTGAGASVAPHGGIATGGGESAAPVDGALAGLGGVLLALGALLGAQRLRRDPDARP